MRGVGVVVLVACSNSAPSAPPAPVEPPQAAPKDAASQYNVEPAPANPYVRLEGTITLGDITIAQDPEGPFDDHKHGKNGRTTGYTHLIVKRGNASEPLTLTTRDGVMRGELVVLGAAFAVRVQRAPEFSLIAAQAPQPLSDEECDERIQQAAPAVGLQLGTSSAGGETDGIYVVRAPGWNGYCGKYTRRIWFEDPPQRD